MDSNIKVTVVKCCRFHTLSNMLIFCLLLNDNGKKMNMGSWGWYGIMDDCVMSNEKQTFFPCPIHL